MIKKEKYHFEPNEVKIDILEFILKNGESVSEVEIREYLKKKYGGINQSSVNRHLHGLEDLGCIELDSLVKKSRSNFWDIKTSSHLKTIMSELPEIQLNTYEKALNIALHNFGVGRKSSRYVYFFIRMRLSPSFFTECLNTDNELLHSRTRKIFNHDKGFKNEQRIEELLKELNYQYIKGKLNFEMSEERIREIMEELSLKMENLFKEYACRVCHCSSELGLVDEIVFNLTHNPSFFQIDQKIWVESFHEKLTERVPELFGVPVETILETPDEYQNIYLKIEEIFSLIIDQNEMFERSYLDLLFEHFYYRDILDGVDSNEKTFAQNTKKITEEYYAALELINKTEGKGKREQFMDVVNNLVLGEMENISVVMAEYQMPSILPDISDDPKEVLIKLLKLYNHHDLLKQLEKRNEQSLC